MLSWSIDLMEKWSSYGTPTDAAANGIGGSAVRALSVGNPKASHLSV